MIVVGERSLGHETALESPCGSLRMSRAMSLVAAGSRLSLSVPIESLWYRAFVGHATTVRRERAFYLSPDEPACVTA